MTIVDHKIEELAKGMKRIEEKIDIIMRHLKIEMPSKIDSNTHLPPVDLELREE
jgi:hypothetical protein